MAAFSLSSLKTEIETDPLGLGYSGLSNAAIVTLINTKSYTVPKPIQMLKLLGQLASSGVLFKLESAKTTASTDALKSKALGMLKLIDNPNVDTFDTSNSTISTILDDLDTGSVITTGEKNAWNALADVSGSRAEVLWGVDTGISRRQVAAALALP